MFNFSLNIKTILQYLTVLLAAVVLLLAVRSGWGSGRLGAQAELNAANAGQVAQALKLFYGDQDRYPTALEFADRNTFGSYVSQFPVLFFASGSCADGYSYLRPDDQHYQFSVCLPAAVSGGQKGWNEVNN